VLVVQPPANGAFGALAKSIAAVLEVPSVKKARPAVVAAAAGKILPPNSLSASSDPPWGEGRKVSPKPSCDTTKFTSDMKIRSVNAIGGLDSAKVTAAVQEQKEELVACYAASRCKNAELMGRVTLRFDILSSGDTMALGNVGSDLGSLDAIMCVMSVMHGTSFPPASKPTRVLVPLVFSPGQ